MQVDPPRREQRWVTGVGAGLLAVGAGMSLVAPADFLGFPVLLGALLLTIGIGARM